MQERTGKRHGECSLALALLCSGSLWVVSGALCSRAALSAVLPEVLDSHLIRRLLLISLSHVTTLHSGPQSSSLTVPLARAPADIPTCIRDLPSDSSLALYLPDNFTKALPWLKLAKNSSLLLRGKILTGLYKWLGSLWTLALKIKGTKLAILLFMIQTKNLLHWIDFTVYSGLFYKTWNAASNKFQIWEWDIWQWHILSLKVVFKVMILRTANI